jgi:hypothetical protein
LHIEVFIRHRWLQKLFVKQIIIGLNFGKYPVGGVRVHFVLASPNLQFFVHEPDAVIPVAVGYAITEVNNFLVLFHVQLNIINFHQRVRIYQKQESRRKNDQVSGRIHQALDEETLLISTFVAVEIVLHEWLVFQRDEGLSLLQ